MGPSHSPQTGKLVLLARHAGRCEAGQWEPLHQYIVWVLMEQLAMDIARPCPVTSATNQFCLMKGCYLLKWPEDPGQENTNKVGPTGDATQTTPETGPGAKLIKISKPPLCS